MQGLHRYKRVPPYSNKKLKNKTKLILMTKNKYLPFNNSTPLHKNNLRAKMSVKKTKQSSTISFTINKADFERNFNNSGKMYQSWGVLIYDPLYFY